MSCIGSQGIPFGRKDFEALGKLHTTENRGCCFLPVLRLPLILTACMKKHLCFWNRLPQGSWRNSPFRISHQRHDKVREISNDIFTLSEPGFSLLHPLAMAHRSALMVWDRNTYLPPMSTHPSQRSNKHLRHLHQILYTAPTA